MPTNAASPPLVRRSSGSSATVVAAADAVLFEVDHIHNHGHRVRNTRRDGTLGKDPRRSSGHWPRYLRELHAHPTTHGLQLLCANCHRAVTAARRETPRIDNRPFSP